MTARSKVYQALLVGCVTLSSVACAWSAIYVGVAVPGPYGGYGGYPYPVGTVGVIGRPPYVCCDDDDRGDFEVPSPQAHAPVAADSTSSVISNQ